MLWGSNAQKKGSSIDKASLNTYAILLLSDNNTFVLQKKHLVLKAAHPSPLSADRGFFGCRHFSKANQYLENKGQTPINWTDLDS